MSNISVPAAQLSQPAVVSVVPLSPQEAFNSALEGVRAQGYEKSFYDGSCLYMSHNVSGSDLKCAIGHCLSDEMIELLGIGGRMTASISTICWEYADIKELFSSCEQEFLQDMQASHDGMVSADGFEQAMKLIAGERGLEYSGPDLI